MNKEETKKLKPKIVEMPDITGMEINEAKKLLRKLNLEFKIEGEGTNITDQLPKKGIKINEGTKVIVNIE